MVGLEEKLKMEKKKLDEIIANSDGKLTNDFILEQSRKVDNLIVAYQKVKLRCISIPMDDLKYKVSKK